VILRQGNSVQGLNTAATLWCSAAVGVQAAGGHILPAIALTVIVLAIHTVLRPLGRRLDKLAGTKTESVSAYTVIVEVARKHEPHVRTLLVRELAVAHIPVRGLTEQTLDDDGEKAVTVQLHADIVVEGPAETILDSIVNRLSLEPGVRGVSWQAEDNETYGDEDLSDPPAAQGAHMEPLAMTTPIRRTRR
jgi:putative Mg2+ transporter-C (MgtC) family protein